MRMLALLAVAACGGGSAPDPGVCQTELDAETLDALTHSFWVLPVIEMQPGDERDIDVGTVQLGGAFETLDACVTWSIDGTGATIDPITGVVHVDAEVASNTRYTVTADIEDGRKRITAEVFVFREAEIPWHGRWREDKQFACGTGDEVAPEQTIEEIIFWADGTLWVTWLPFEIYIDYWGTHAFASDAALTITPESGNYIPPDVDGTGTFALEGDALVLRDLWLGSPNRGTQPANCGHRLTR
jgi:hypothetical protein